LYLHPGPGPRSRYFADLILEALHGTPRSLGLAPR
jgi:hypothetical protein